LKREHLYRRQTNFSPVVITLNCIIAYICYFSLLIQSFNILPDIFMWYIIIVSLTHLETQILRCVVDDGQCYTSGSFGMISMVCLCGLHSNFLASIVAMKITFIK